MSQDTTQTPALRLFRGRTRSLADEQQEKTAYQLGYLAIALAIWTLLGLISLSLPRAQALITPLQYQVVIWASVFFSAVSIGMFLVSRSRLEAQTKLDIGLVYQFLGSLVYAIEGLYSMPQTIRLSLDGVSYIIIWVTVFPIVAPNKFRRSFVANILASSTLYIAHGLLTALDAIQLDLQVVMMASGPVISVALLTMIPVYFHNKMQGDLKNAEKMGSYELVNKIGEGAMGEVWRARHNLLAHETAIKLIKPESLYKQSEQSNQNMALMRFEREAQATAALKSPNTVSLFDFGVSDNGVCYYVMEYLDGVDLDTLVQRFGPIEPNRTVYLLRQICYSLIEAHEADMIHRDIKPANIFICRLKPYHDVIKVLDFGLVKRTLFNAQETKLTIDGMLAGTPAFLSPEQAKGQQDIDGRADIYSLGCVAYWLLTGCQVFEESTPIKVIMAHMSEDPVKPSDRSELFIPTDLEDLVLRCLEKDPGQRPQNVRELEQLLSQIGFETNWNLQRAETWWHTHLPAGKS